MRPSVPLRYDPGLVEQAVFLAIESHLEAKKFHRDRDRVYRIAHPEERERAFQDLHQAWFFRLGLSEQIEKAISEEPRLSSEVKSCLVSRAPGKQEEGAELFVNPEEKLSERERRTVGIFLRPESLLDPSALLTFLRHELMHIADMLDPAFGYEPDLPTAEGGPTHDRLLKDRYRVLWDATIDGRMVRRGWGADSVRNESLREFCRTFPMFGQQSESLFGRFFDHEPHTHVELVAFVFDPRAIVGTAKGPHQGSRCPLCGFPTYTFEPEPERLSPELILQITRDFPAWQCADGLCVQCADIYRAHAVSTSASQILPGNLFLSPQK